MDLLLDPATGDLDLTNGLSWVSGAKEARQRIDLAINLNLGEFFSHVNYGLPWIRNAEEDLPQNIRYFLGDNFPHPEEFIKNELDRYILGLPLVDTLDSSAEIHLPTRKFKYTYSVVTSSGETINFPPYLQTI